MTTYIKDTVSVKIIEVEGQEYFSDWNTWWIVSKGHSLVSNTLLSTDTDLHFIPSILMSSHGEISVAHFYQILYFVIFPF